MLAGKVNPALQLLTTESNSGVHEVNDEMISGLEEKHQNLHQLKITIFYMVHLKT